MTFDATQLTRLSRVAQVALSPDATWLAVEVARLSDDEKCYYRDLWRVPTDGGAPHRLTGGDSSESSPQFRRDGSLVFVSNRPAPGQDDKHRRPQVWLLPALGGEPIALTDEPLGVSDVRVARASDQMVVIAEVLPGIEHEQQRARADELADKGPSGLHYRSMPIRFWDHWLALAAPHLIAYSDDGKDRRDLTPSADREYRPGDLSFGWDLSADGSTVAIPCARVGADRAPEASLHLIDVATGQVRELGREDRAIYSGPRFSPDGKRLIAERQRRADGTCGRLQLRLFELGSGQVTTVADDWDVWPYIDGWTPDGSAVVVHADVRGTSPVYRIDLANDRPVRITSEAAGGCHGDVSVAERDGQLVAYGIRHTMLSPPEPFRVVLDADAEPTVLCNLSGLEPGTGASLAAVESFEVAGDGGTPVQSFLVVPRGVTRPETLLWIHGGPVSQHVDGWHWRWNPLVAASAGYAVALPNPRGSTGRGQAFIEGVWNNEWGAACYRDLVAVADALEKRSDIDGSCMAAMGGSFGGYMANWIGSQTDRFACLVTHASIYHFTAFHGATDEPGWFALELGGTPYGDVEAFERYSPHRFVKNWKSPTLILHGERDYRVPVSEALLLFEALQLHGVDSELVIFPDENHWIARPQNARQWYEVIFEFTSRHMKEKSR